MLKTIFQYYDRSDEKLKEVSREIVERYGETHESINGVPVYDLYIPVSKSYGNIIMKISEVREYVIVPGYQHALPIGGNSAAYRKAVIKTFEEMDLEETVVVGAVSKKDKKTIVKTPIKTLTEAEQLVNDLKKRQSKTSKKQLIVNAKKHASTNDSVKRMLVYQFAEDNADLAGSKEEIKNLYNGVDIGSTILKDIKNDNFLNKHGRSRSILELFYDEIDWAHPDTYKNLMVPLTVFLNHHDDTKNAANFSFVDSKKTYWKNLTINSSPCKQEVRQKLVNLGYLK